MAGLVIFLLVTINYVTSSWSRMTDNVKGKHFGPAMCVKMCQMSTKISTFMREYHCRRMSKVDFHSADFSSRENPFICITKNKTECPDFDRESGEKRTGSECTSLHSACKKGDVCEVQSLLSHSLENINCRDKIQETPIMTAALYGQEAIFDLLVSKGSDLKLVTAFNKTLLHVACRGGNIHIVQRLVEEFGLDIESRDGSRKTPALTAALNNHTQVVKYLLDKGYNMKLTDVEGNNILHYSCKRGNDNLVRYILAKGVLNKEVRGKHGRTPLLIGTYYGRIKVFKTLMEARCNLKAVDDLNYNVLHVACAGGHIYMVRYVLSLGIYDKESRQYMGKTPLMLAIVRRRTDVFEFLLSEGCNPRAVDRKGISVFKLACRKSRRFLRLLIKARVQDNC